LFKLEHLHYPVPWIQPIFSYLRSTILYLFFVQQTNFSVENCSSDSIVLFVWLSLLLPVHWQAQAGRCVMW